MQVMRLYTLPKRFFNGTIAFFCQVLYVYYIHEFEKVNGDAAKYCSIPTLKKLNYYIKKRLAEGSCKLLAILVFKLFYRLPIVLVLKEFYLRC